MAELWEWRKDNYLSWNPIVSTIKDITASILAQLTIARDSKAKNLVFNAIFLESKMLEKLCRSLSAINSLMEKRWKIYAQRIPDITQILRLPSVLEDLEYLRHIIKKINSQYKVCMT